MAYSAVGSSAGDQAELAALRCRVAELTGQLAESEARFQAAVDCSPRGFVVYDRERRILHVNRWAQQVAGRPLADLRGRRDEEVYPAALVAEYLPYLERAIATGEPQSLHWHLPPSYGGLTLAIQYVPLADATGAVIQVLAMTQDLTERQHTQQELLASQERLELAQAATGVGIFDWDMIADTSTVSPEWRRVYGFPPDGPTITHEHWRNAVHPADRERATECALTGARSGERYTDEFRVVWPDGSVRWVESSGKTFRDPDGQNRRFIGTAFDITERKLAEETLRTGESTLRSFYESAPLLMGVVETTEDDILHVSGNPAAARFFGRETSGYRASELGVPHTDIRLWLEHYQQTMAAGQPVHFEIDSPQNGQPLILSVSVSLIGRMESGRPRFSYVAEDITFQKRAEAALRESEARFRQIAEAAPIIVWVTSANGGVEYLNHQWYHLTGQPAAGGLAGDRTGWTQAVHPDDLPRCSQLWRECVAGGGPFTAELRVRAGDGSYRWLLCRGLPVREVTGEALRWVGVSVDIHARKEAELTLRRANEDLRQFGYAASHDLQEPLRMVTTYTQLLARRYGSLLDEQGRQFAGHAVQGALRMDALLRDLRAYWQVSEPAEQPSYPVPVGEVLARVQADLQCALEECGGTITADPLPAVQAHRVAVQQLLLNLFSNALKYRRSGVPLQVQVSAVRQGGWWRLTVRDNGRGISSQHYERIFRLFKRLDPSVPGGTGMGLAICRRIVERYGGEIWVESEPGQGSAFHCTLPACQ